jgi:hypothetical protein
VAFIENRITVRCPAVDWWPTTTVDGLPVPPSVSDVEPGPKTLQIAPGDQL